MLDRVLNLLERLFGKKRFRLNAAAAVAFLVVACMSTLGTLIYIGVIDNSRYQVSGLTVTQRDTCLDVRWDKEDCSGYEVFLFRNGQRPKVTEAKTNFCRLEMDELGGDYRVVVTAKGKGGAVAGAKAKNIATEKVEQEIHTSQDAFVGFEGKEDVVEARAKEKVVYESSNEKVVAVADDGTLEYKQPGEAEISIMAEEGDQYKEGEKTVDVTVFPEVLDTPAAEIEEVRGLDVTLKWSHVDFAQKYLLLKKEPASGDYDVIDEFDGETEAADLPRDNAAYAIVATADVNGQTVESKPSEDVEVKSASADAESYSGYHNLETLDKSNLELIADVKGLGGATVPQSMSLKNGNFVISYASHSGSVGALVTYDQDGNRIGEKSVSGMGHANGSTYNPNTDRIYTVKTHRAIRSKSCTTFGGEGYSESETFSLPRTTSGIAYDTSNNKYYLSKGNEIYVTDADFNVEEFIWKKIRYNHAQDIGAANGVAMVCTWISGNESYIDLYRVSDGAYIGGYSVPIGEIESVVMVDKHLVILMNNSGGGNVDQILRTVDPVELP